MQDHTLVGKRVMNRTTKSIGTIKSVKDGKVFVFDGFDTFAYQYPAAFADTLILEDEGIQEELKSESYDAKSGSFKAIYANAIRREISYLKETGGKKYKIVDGDRILNSNSEESYIYSFDTDSELHFPDGTVIRLWLENDKPFANVISCEEFTIVFRTTRYLGEKVDYIEFTAEPWQLMESLIERLDDLGTWYHYTFTANIEAGNQEQLIIKELVESYGLSITPGDAPGGICAVATIQDIMKKFGYGNLDHTLRLCIATWEGAPHSLSSNILKSIAILIHVYGDELSDETFKEKLGSVSLKEIMRNAKERRSGSMGYAEALVTFYAKGTRGGKNNLSLEKLYSYMTEQARKHKSSTSRIKKIAAKAQENAANDTDLGEVDKENAQLDLPIEA